MSHSDFSKPVVQNYLKRKEIAVLATVNDQGMPLATPMWFVHDKAGIGMVSHSSMRKMKNLERNPHVSVTVESGSGGNIECIIIQGKAELLRDTQARNRMGELFVDKYGKFIEELWGGTSVPQTRALFRIHPLRVKLWGTLADA